MSVVRMTLWFAVLWAAACSTTYARRMPSADDPSNPDAPASAPSHIALWGADAGVEAGR